MPRSKSASSKSGTSSQSIIPSKEQPEIYRCWCCGKEYAHLRGNFTPTNFPLFKYYGYFPICRHCTDKFFEEMTEFFDGSQEKAIEFICSMYGIYFHDSPLASSGKINQHKSRIHSYVSKVQIKPWVGLSFLDTLRERKEQDEHRPIESSEDIEKASEKFSITPKMIRFWGVGYEPNAYITLQGYYDELLKLCSEKPDVKQQKMMKTLCLLEYQMQVNLQAGKDIGSLSNSYKATFESAGLKTEVVADTSNDTLGTWIMEIEKYSPAEYYKDKSRYHDFFGIVDYIERFMYRPLRNLIFGTKEKEKEYWVSDDDIVYDTKGGE